MAVTHERRFCSCNRGRTTSAAGRVRSMFDLHVHAAPDIWPRLGDDQQILRWYADAGFSGCVLKGHYDATMGRAVAASAGLRLRAYGGQALNQHVGGINPAAVAAALAMGARVIWMPTADAHPARRRASPLVRPAAPPCRDYLCDPAGRLVDRRPRPEGVTHAYVIENEITYLAFPVPAAAMAILGAGTQSPCSSRSAGWPALTSWGPSGRPGCRQRG